MKALHVAGIVAGVAVVGYAGLALSGQLVGGSALDNWWQQTFVKRWLDGATSMSAQGVIAGIRRKAGTAADGSPRMVRTDLNNVRVDVNGHAVMTGRVPGAAPPAVPDPPRMGRSSRMIT